MKPTCQMPTITNARSRPGSPCRSTVDRWIDGVPLCYVHATAVENHGRTLAEARGETLAIGFHGTKAGGCWPWVLKRSKTERQRRRAAAAVRRAERKLKLRRRKKTSPAAPPRRRG